MRVGIIQSNFLPWRGYFDFIRSVDLFLFHDDLQYTKGDWRNRNRIKTPRGLEWITVPVKYASVEQLIQDTPIDDSTAWATRMLNRIRENYRTAPHLNPYWHELRDLLLQPAGSISELNVRLIRWACGHLGITTPMRFAAEFHPSGSKTERLVSILTPASATIYLSGPAAKAYLDENLLHQAGIELEYKTYRFREYPQLYPPFDPAASILDVLFMTGPEAAAYLEPPNWVASQRTQPVAVAAEAR